MNNTTFKSFYQFKKSDMYVKIYVTLHDTDLFKLDLFESAAIRSFERNNDLARLGILEYLEYMEEYLENY